MYKEKKDGNTDQPVHAQDKEEQDIFKQIQVAFDFDEIYLNLVPYLARGDGVFSNKTNNNILGGTIKGTKQLYNNSKTQGEVLGATGGVDNWGKKIGEGDYTLELGDGEVHYLLFDKMIDTAEIEFKPNGVEFSGDVIDILKDNYGIEMSANAEEIDIDNVKHTAIRLSGGKDYMKYNRVQFDQELFVYLKTNGAIPANDYVEPPYENKPFFENMYTGKIAVTGQRHNGQWTSYSFPTQTETGTASKSTFYLFKNEYFETMTKEDYAFLKNKFKYIPSQIYLLNYHTNNTYYYYFNGNECDADSALNKARFESIKNNKCIKVEINQPAFYYDFTTYNANKTLFAPGTGTTGWVNNQYINTLTYDYLYETYQVQLMEDYYDYLYDGYGTEEENILLDEDGNKRYDYGVTLFRPKLDENGNPVLELRTRIRTDEYGNRLYDYSKVIGGYVYSYRVLSNMASYNREIVLFVYSYSVKYMGRIDAIEDFVFPFDFEYAENDVKLVEKQPWNVGLYDDLTVKEGFTPNNNNLYTTIAYFADFPPEINLTSEIETKYNVFSDELFESNVKIPNKNRPHINISSSSSSLESNYNHSGKYKVVWRCCGNSTMGVNEAAEFMKYNYLREDYYMGMGINKSTKGSIGSLINGYQNTNSYTVTENRVAINVPHSSTQAYRTDRVYIAFPPNTNNRNPTGNNIFFSSADYDNNNSNYYYITGYSAGHNYIGTNKANHINPAGNNSASNYTFYTQVRAKQKLAWEGNNNSRKYIVPYYFFNRFPFRYELKTTTDVSYSQFGNSPYLDKAITGAGVVSKNIVDLKTGKPMPSISITELPINPNQPNNNYSFTLTIWYRIFSDISYPVKVYNRSVTITVYPKVRQCHSMYTGRISAETNDSLIRYVDDGKAPELIGPQTKEENWYSSGTTVNTELHMDDKLDLLQKLLE
jgi:hypothetical protein